MFLHRLNITTGSSAQTEGAISQGFLCWRLFLRGTNWSCYSIAAPTIFKGKWVDIRVDSVFFWAGSCSKSLMERMGIFFLSVRNRVCGGEEIHNLLESVQLHAEIAVMHSQPTQEALQESVGITLPRAAVKAVARHPLGQSAVVAVTRGKGQIW